MGYVFDLFEAGYNTNKDESEGMFAMKKRYLAAIGALGVGAATSYFAKKRNKNEGMADTLTNAGMPDQVDYEDHSQLENSKMVSEGSQFGVQYYNHQKSDEVNQ